MLCIAVISLSILTCTCGTNPYSEEQADKLVYFTSYPDDPKHLDPAVSYYEHEAVVIDNIYETLYQYNYLRRPYHLEPALAETYPVISSDGLKCTVKIKPGILFHDDPCLPLSPEHGVRTRELTAEDFVTALKRVADPKLPSPIRPVFSGFIAGMTEFTEANKAKEKTDYDIPLAGVVARDSRTLEITLRHPYPQIKYWLAMHFTSPVPREAVDYYDGRDGRLTLNEHPVGTGPFYLKAWDKRLRIVLERNPQFREEYYPDTGEASDVEHGMLEDRGKRLPLLDQVYMAYETEAIPRWRKFLQGWYDGTGLAKEVFDRVVTNQHGLSDDMASRGMKLVRTAEPSIFYIAFNMNDSTIGGTSVRTRKLRQAISCAFDAPTFLRILMNGRGIQPHEIVPAGIFGRRNDTSPYAGPNLEKAKALLAEAGYPFGVDPKTKRPLVITFDNTLNGASDRPMLQFIQDQFSSIGIKLEARTTDLNTYRTKIREGNYQMVMTGWNLDYPDPENIFFLLSGDQATVPFGGENNANFRNAEFDLLFNRMARMENTPEREKIIWRMTEIVREECPWVPIFFSEAYSLTHAWVGNFKPGSFGNNVWKYRDIERASRDEYRAAEAKPIYWPMAVLLALAALATYFGLRSIKRKEI